jgi:LacI family transcriptional regulator
LKKVTIDDVAHLAGVSKGTVSAVINQKKTVNPETRDHILDAIKKLNYRPRASARNLRKERAEPPAIGLLIRRLDNPIFAEMAIGVMDYCTERGYLLYIASSEGDHLYEDTVTDSFADKDIKGALISPIIDGTTEIEHLFKLKMLNFPFVLLENIKGIKASIVSIDNSGAIKDAMKFLMANGHSNIVHFAGPESSYLTAKRIDGFRQAFSESPFTFKNNMIVAAGSRLEDGYRAAMEYFKDRRRDEYPTAIICFNDLVAIGAMSALSELNIRIPEDVSVIGHDDITFARYTPVRLTTVRIPMRELGRKAAELLIDSIEASEPLPVTTILLPTELIVRDSTRSLSSSYPAIKEEHTMEQPH